MFFKGDRRKRIQKVIEENYLSITGFKLKWLAGEKPRVVKVISLMADLKNEHEDFDVIIFSFNEYVEKATKEWLVWPDGNRTNYIGYLHKTERLKQFCLRDASETPTTQDQEEWSDF